LEDFEEKDEDMEIDFGKVTSFFKRKKREKKIEVPKEEKRTIETLKEELKPMPSQVRKEELNKESEEEKEDEEISINLGKIKNIFKKKKREEFRATVEKESEDISIDWKKTGKFFKTYGVIFLILIPIILSIHFRMYPSELPITDDWAKATVYNHYKSQIQSEIDQQYPNLPDANKQTLIDNQFQQLLKEQKTTINQQIQEVSNQYKQQFKDDTGQTYLLAIDPYLWYGEARNYVENGHFGTEIVDGKEINFLRNGRLGKEMPATSLLSYLEVFLFKFLHFFDKTTSLMGVCFIMPVILVTLSTIFAFLIAKRISGNIGGLFAGIIIAINAALLGRTPAGFSDTDAFNVLFPLMIAWIFLEAFETKNKTARYSFAGLGGLLVGLYSLGWSGWVFMFYFVLFVTAIYFIYQLIIYFKNKKEITPLKNTASIGIILLLSSVIFVSLLRGFNVIGAALTAPINFISIKAVAVTSIWPNVLTTVAEFNEIALKDIMSQMGGTFLFFIAIIGIILTILTKKDIYKKIDIKYATFLTIWFIGTTYAFTKGTRFAILLVPAFAISFGAACGIIYKYASKWTIKEMHIPGYLTKTILIILLCLLLISPLRSAKVTATNELPSMNDAWFNSLTAIKEDSKDGMITSWWDFGHWFVAVSERRVTFDGADQGRRIHWVGKTLLTADEDEAIDILKMLNCGQEKPSFLLEEYMGDNFKAIETLKKIIRQDRETAEETLLDAGLTEKQAKEVLELTHCEDLIDQYYIASEDMIGKSGVWGHFGSWDFERAAMYQAVKKKEPVQGINILKTKFNLSEDEASDIYYEIKNNNADSWVSQWPSYAQNTLSGCVEDGNLIMCGNGLEFNIETEDATIQTQQGMMYVESISFINKKDKFELKVYNNNTIPYSAALIPYEGGYVSILMDQKLAASMFTRLFFFEGHGLKHFKPFVHEQQVTGGHIYIYKVDWESDEEVIVEKFLKKHKEKEIEEIEEAEEETKEGTAGEDEKTETTDKGTDNESNITE